MDLQQRVFQKQQQSQKLAMTQQLKQAINILQFNLDELSQFMQSKALENPLIELEQPELVDFSFSTKSSSINEEERNKLFEQIPDRVDSLYENLEAQIYLNYRDTPIRQRMFFLLEYIDKNGYLTISLEEAAELSHADHVVLLDALTLLQQLDPAGIGARNLRECLMLQTERDDEAPATAYLLLEEEFDDLVSRKWQKIADKYDLSLADIQQVFDYIQTLSPSPGNIFGRVQEQYIVPDLAVEIKDQQLFVHPLQDHLPKLNFQANYFKKLEKTDDPEVMTYLKEKKQEFDWLKKTIDQRGDTIYRVGSLIVAKQKDFFLDAARPLKPMTLREIADELQIHESTVSRSVNGKYLQTSFGVYELRSFFISGFTLGCEEETVSSQEIKKKLLQIIAEEKKQKPLSDQKIVERLSAAGFPISRRTVAKYREELGIASSSKRKRFD